MEMLSVMFGAMNAARAFGQLLKPAMTLVGLQETWNQALEAVFLPVMEMIQPIVQAFSDALSNMSEGGKKLIGVFVLLGFILFKGIFTVAQLTLFMG
jgi:hypothetical protein